MAQGAGVTPKKARKGQPEQAIQRMLVKSLRFILPRESLLFAVPNGGKRSPIEGAIFVGQGVVRGMPDLMLLWSSRAFGMEVKSATGSLTDDQAAVHSDLKRAGVPVTVVRSLDDAINFLRANEVPLRLADDGREHVGNR